MKKKNVSNRSPSFMEPLEGRQLLSGSHTVSPTKITFTTTAASGTIANPIAISVSAKLTANGLPLRTATVYFVVDGKNLLDQAVTGRSGYATMTIPNVYAGTHSIAAYFLAATRYKAATSAGKSVTITTPSLTTTSDGLQYATITPGSGATAVSGQKAHVNYAGYLTTGSLFDTSFQTRNPQAGESIVDGGTTLGAVLDGGSVIAGFNEGIKGMKVGETRVLVIPPSLGYGANPNGNIPANSTLIFFVKLESLT